jgi:hypothetical protein
MLMEPHCCWVRVRRSADRIGSRTLFSVRPDNEARGAGASCLTMSGMHRSSELMLRYVTGMPSFCYERERTKAFDDSPNTGKVTSSAGNGLAAKRLRQDESIGRARDG